MCGAWRWLGIAAIGVAVFAWAQPPELLLYAPFDQSGEAAFARGNAKQLGGSLTFVPGLHGHAVSLTSDCVFSVGRNFHPEAGTIAAWIRPHWAGAEDGNHYFFCLYGHRDLPESWNRNRYNVNFAGGQCHFAIFTGEGGKTISVSAPIRHWQPQEWHHVAVTWRNVNSGRSDAELRLYLDGELAAAATNQQIEVGPTNDVMAIGRDQDASPDYGAAELDDLFIYGRALSTEEIAQGVAQSRVLPYETKGPAPSGAPPPGWHDPARPYRVPIVLPATEHEHCAPFLECVMQPQLADLGRPGVPDMASIRVLADSGAEGRPVELPAHVEDNIVQWPLPGEIATRESCRFWIYFSTLTFQFPQPLVAQRVALADTAGAQLEVPSVPDYATLTYGKAWNFDDGTFCGIDQWGNKPEYIRNRKVENGILSFDVSHDPWFIWGDMWGQVAQPHQKVAIDLDKFPVLEMKIRQSVPVAKWELYGRVGTSTNLLYHEFSVFGTGWQRIRIDLRREARWSGVLSAFRIDPTQDVPEAHIEIDWIRLLHVTPVEHGGVQTIGTPSAKPASVIVIAKTPVRVRSEQEIIVRVKAADGQPVQGQPVLVFLPAGSDGLLQAAAGYPSLMLNERTRRALTNEAGEAHFRLYASRRAGVAEALTAEAEFASAPASKALLRTFAGPPHHYRVTPTRVVAVKGNGPLRVSAQLVDEFDNPLPSPGKRLLKWTTDAPAILKQASAVLNAKGEGQAIWQGDESRRWVYHIRVRDSAGLSGESAAICLLPSQPRRDPIVLGPNGYFRKGKNGPIWLPLGGFYANWVGLPEKEGGEEGRRVLSFVEATEEQIDHWLAFLASQGVTALRFMLRAHTKQGMAPMDIIGRVNMPLFAKVLRYMDLARKYDIRFMLTIHEDYTKPAYYNRQALETFCIPQYAGEDLDRLPPPQRRFIRDRRLIGVIGEKYTDPDVIACQDQYTRALVGLLKDNPQLFAWEFENEMVDCPRSWAQHMARVIRSVDPTTPICASHGGGGLHTADPLWWTRYSGIDFYTYHLYPHRGSTSGEVDYGAAVDILTTYGRMAGVCMLGEAAGDEFSYYPAERDADRRYLMRDIIWLSLVNSNPGCFFWNARGDEVAQFRLAKEIFSTLDLAHWRRPKGSISVVVRHPLEDDKYYRTPQGQQDYWMMGRYVQHFRARGETFDFVWEPEANASVADLKEFKPPLGSGPCTVSPGWQIAAMPDESGQGVAYVRNMAGIWHWAVPKKCDMFLRERRPAPLILTFHLGAKRYTVRITDLDTGETREANIAGGERLDLGVSEHDWAIVWRPAP